MKSFLFPPVLSRLPYALRWVGWGAFISVATTIHAKLVEGENPSLVVQISTLVVFVAAVAYLGFSVVRPRLKNIGANAWLAWLLIVPLANVVMLLALVFIPGNAPPETQSA